MTSDVGLRLLHVDDLAAATGGRSRITGTPLEWAEPGTGRRRAGRSRRAACGELGCSVRRVLPAAGLAVTASAG